MRRTSRTPRIPLIFNLAWLGSDFPQESLSLLVRLIASEGCTVNLLVDERIRFYRTEEIALGGHFLSRRSNLNLITSAELLENARDSQFYQSQRGSVLLREFEICLLKESHGLKNYGAYSDLARYEMLRAYGGYWLDLDNEIDSLYSNIACYVGASDPLPLKGDRAKEGVLFIQRRKYSICGGVREYGDALMTGNHAMAVATPDHPMIQYLLIQIVTSYMLFESCDGSYEKYSSSIRSLNNEHLRQCVYPELADDCEEEKAASPTATPLSKKVNAALSCLIGVCRERGESLPPGGALMDRKRIGESRFGLTLGLSGPIQLHNVIDRYYSNDNMVGQHCMIPYEEGEGGVLENMHTATIAGVSMTHLSTQLWAHREEGAASVTSVTLGETYSRQRRSEAEAEGGETKEKTKVQFSVGLRR